MRPGGCRLRGRALDLFLSGYVLEGLEVLLCGNELAVSLRVGNLRLIHQPARYGAYLDQLPAASEYHLGGLHRLTSRLHVGLRLHDAFRDCGSLCGTKNRFSLIHRAPGFGGGRNKVAVLEDRKQLALPYVIAPVDIELLYRRGNLGRQWPLILREECTVATDYPTHCLRGYYGDLDGRGRLFCRLFCSGTAGAERKNCGDDREE